MNQDDWYLDAAKWFQEAEKKLIKKYGSAKWQKIKSKEAS